MEKSSLDNTKQVLSSHSGHRELTPRGAPWRHSSVRVSCLSPAPSLLSLSLLVRGSPRTGPGEEKSGWLRVSEGRGTAAVIHITHSESWSCRGFTVRQTYVHIPALPLPGCLTSGKPLALSVPGFPHPQLPPRCREASEEERGVWHGACTPLALCTVARRIFHPPRFQRHGWAFPTCDPQTRNTCKRSSLSSPHLPSASFLPPSLSPPLGQETEFSEASTQPKGPSLALFPT